ncbi:ABC transporter permease [Diplocloster hominis]|uniref:ABC transporter permease n=1 Tax=Diplocloster hominis TaxID=3079010 RepID=UPI0031BB3FA5
MKNFAKNFVKRKEFGIILIVVILSVILTFLSSAFLTVTNIMDFMKSNSVYGIMAFGMLPVLISAGIDLSVSATIALSAVVIGKFMLAFPNSNPVIVILVAMIVGAAVGVINGLIITKFNIPPIVTTLGVMTIVNGAVLLGTGGAWISGLPQWWVSFGSFKLFGIIPTQLFMLIFAGLVTWLILKFTLVGRGIYAVGGSQSSAVRVGYNVNRILIFIYAFCGMMAGLGAAAHISIVGQVDPNTYTGYELDVISTVVLGGASVMGGTGTVFGTTLGVILMAVLKNGLILARIPNYWQKVVMGLVIIIAVSVDVINRKREQAKLVRVDVEE